MDALRVLLLLAMVTLLTAGCVTHTASPAVNGKAYVVDGSIFGTGLLFCDATGVGPECWPVEEQELQ